MVFGFSNDNAEKSTGLSMKVSKIFTQDVETLKIIEPIIRKLAHLTEYTIGGILFYGLLLTFNISAKKQVIFSGGIGIIYAITDEIHQLFVPRKSRKSRRCNYRFFWNCFRNLYIIIIN